MAVELVIEGEPRPLPTALELSAYRIVQEGLTNALKHAAPARARVVLRYGERELEVEVADDGAQAGSGRGNRRGLAGIGERVAVFGGRLEAGPRSEGGWTLRAAFPLAR
jgi:signal transduction histidine kinase